jgi:hypothetical protein
LDWIGLDSFSVWFDFFQQADKQYFLKKGLNISPTLQGTPLDELILFDSNRFDGMILNENSVSKISKYIYDKLINFKEKKIKIQNSELAVYLYSLCKVDDFVFLNVWEIITSPFNQERSSWEKQYEQDPYSCCQENYLAKHKLTLNDQDSNSISTQILEKNCIYNKSYIECVTQVFSHLFNFTGEDCEWFDKDEINLVFNPIFQVTPYGKDVLFRYNKWPVLKPIKCIDLYDSIIFDTTNEPTIEHNFQNFLSDALFTCFSYQTQIKNGDIPLEEQRLVCLTICL